MDHLVGVIFGDMYSERFSKGLLEASGLHCGSILEGLGAVRGGFGKGLGTVWRVKNCISAGPRFGFRVLVACGFGGVWAASKVFNLIRYHEKP